MEGRKKASQLNLKEETLYDMKRGITPRGFRVYTKWFGEQSYVRLGVTDQAIYTSAPPPPQKTLIWLRVSEANFETYIFRCAKYIILCEYHCAILTL